MGRSVLASAGLMLAALCACSEPVQVGSSEELLTASRVIQRGTAGAVTDSYVSASAMKKDFGSQKKLLVSAKNEALLRFDLSSIPANAVIDRASLTLFANGGEEEADDDGDDGDHEGHAIAPIRLHRATAAWSEATVTYASFGQRFDPAVAGVIVLDSRRTLKTVDVKPLVQAWVAGTQPNFGVVLTTAGRAHTLFASSEHNQVSQRPALAISYTVPDDHCAPNPCAHGGTCSNQVAGFTCACAAGYQGDRCQAEIDDCAAGPCVHGTCTDIGLGYACRCEPGYQGGNCQFDIDECAVGPCANGGTCTQGVNSYACACLPGFGGARCEIDIDECAGAPCQNGGTCTDHVNGYTCACAAGYEGSNCEINHDDCPGNACDHGTCQDGLGAYTCACEPGYQGDRCDKDIVDCTPDACFNGGTCVERVLGYTCTCPAGFAGDRCEVDVDDCAAQPCAHGGTCVDRVNAFTCQCTPGYQGATCAGCAIGLADCDGDVSNGCELPDTSDILNCGACGHVCPAFLSGPVCSGGVCDFAPLAQCNTVVCDANGGNCQTTPVANGTTFVRSADSYCVFSFGGLCLKTEVDTVTCTCQHGTATSCETVVKICLLGFAC